MSKYYAIKNGKIPGIYTDWETAKLQINQYKGAVYKSFKTKKEAEAFMGHDVHHVINISSPIDILVYTDGSCKNQIGGYGIVIINKPVTDVRNNIHNEYYGYIPNPCTNQIAELYAIYQALLLLEDYKDLHILIKSDSEYSINCLTKFIYKWEKNNYQTLNNETIKNKDLIVTIFNLLKTFDHLQFEHVYSHCNEYYNEIVDLLAKKSTGA